MLDLAIIIVNYNTRSLLLDCLGSIYASQGEFRYQVWVVDNASDDGSVEAVREAFPQTQVIANRQNIGYPQANNVGLRAAGWTDAPGDETSRPRFALLLNPDTVLPATALADMLAFMEAHPDAGVAGPKLVRADGTLDLACRRSFPSPAVSFYRMIGLSRLFPDSPRFARYNLTYLDPNKVAEIDAVVGAFMLVRGEAIQQVGLLDEEFFMYGEDLDWCYRIKAAGWRVYYNPAVKVLHYKRESSKQNRRKAQYEFYRAMYLFYRKHYAAEMPLPLHWLILAGIVTRGALAMTAEVLRSWREERRLAEAGSP